ncbi:ran-binding protein 3 [Exaiptasia diaphana]|uniref:RanBD1 domain-containing protein n=1 Tax=Exaiptasia diaphana TaxID=2652724 RepID=A0A913XQP7_EXADI|nr:ran-binding protein 3 [Exaiptasia diaphana]KXJ09968.1 Ran-binding protein 3 [Exaiptasia diaphana]
MAETSAPFEESAQIGAQASVVAPPKFVFGQSMSERVKDPSCSAANENTHENQDTNGSDMKEEDRTSAKKRPAEDDNDKEDTSESDIPSSPSHPEGPTSPVKKVAKVFKWTEEEDEEPKQFKLKPSILTQVAKNLTGTAARCSKDEDSNSATTLPKTFGLSTSESSSNETRTGASAPEPIIGTSKNYFQMFLEKNNESIEKQKAGSFVFGCNMSDRVTFATHTDDEKNESSENTDKQETEEPTPSEDPPQVTSVDKEPKTLEQVAKSCVNEDGPKSPTSSPDKHHLSLAEAAKVYEDTAVPSKSKLEHVEVVTGEEEERNVLKVNCRLFMFDVDNHSWREKGRGLLRLNDMCQSSSESTFQSRLIMRTQGHLRVTLNTKLWPEMTLERANERSLRITGFDADNDVKIYLIMAGPKDIQQLFTAIDRRIQSLKLNKGQQHSEADSTADTSKETDENIDTKKDVEQEVDSESTSTENRRVIGQDSSSNDSCPVVRSKDSFSDDE